MAVAVLNPLYVRRRLQSALAIGGHVIGAFYRGDPAAYSRKGRKQHSLRRPGAGPPTASSRATSTS